MNNPPKKPFHNCLSLAREDTHLKKDSNRYDDFTTNHIIFDFKDDKVKLLL